jgi:hypothetical protein
MIWREQPERFLVDLSPALPAGEDSVRGWAAGQSVFVSGVIAGMEEERKAAVDAITSVGARAVMFEEFGGMDDDAEDAYLANVAASDIYLGVLGGRYGKPLKSGYSATHAEYNEAVRRGLRISVWAPPDGLDGPQRDFLEAIRVFHTTGSYSSAEDLAARVERRLRTMATESLSPWVKVGNTIFRARSVTHDGTTVTVKAHIRDNTVAASLEARRPSMSYGGGTETRITWPGGTARVRVGAVEVEVGAGRALNVTVTAGRTADEHSGLLEMAFESRTPEDLTELAMRVALLGEPNPLGSMGFMVEAENPLPALEGLGLPEDSLPQVGELLATEILVGGRGVDHLTAFRLGPKHQGRRRLLLAWMPRRRYTNIEPVERRIEGWVDVLG